MDTRDIRKMTPEEKLALKKKILAQQASKEPEEGLEESGIEDYIMPIRSAIKGGMKATILNAMKKKAVPVAEKIVYDKKPNPKGWGAKEPKVVTRERVTVGTDMPDKEKDIVPEWLRKILDEE